MDGSQVGWTLLLPVEEQELERLGVTREPSTVAFGRRLTFDEMLTVGEILAELYHRTPDRDVNDIQHAVAAWARQADEWFGRGVGMDLAVSMLRFPQHVARATFEPSSDDDQAIKSEMIAAWFDDLEERVRFIEQLIRDGRHSEAIILSLVYIEGLGNNAYPDGTHSMRNFVRLIDEHGDAERLLLVHPGALLDALPRRNAVGKATVAVLTASIPLTRTNLVTREELMQATDPLLKDEQRAWLGEELWRGTVAGVIHAHMRNNAVKRGLPSKLFFGETIYQGRPVGTVDVHTLHTLLVRIVRSVRQLSLTTNKWFGSDGVL